MYVFYQHKWLSVILLLFFITLFSCSKKEVNFADHTPPFIISTYPENGATNVTVDLDKIVVTFSEDIDPDTATFSAIKMDPVIYGEIRAVENKLTIFLHSGLEYDTKYTIIITTKITDLFGNHLKSNYSFSFSTEHDDIPPPPPLFFSTNFITNQNPFIVGGTKQPGSGIKVNGDVYVPVDYSSSFTIQLSLVEGENLFSVTSFDRAGNESAPVIIKVILDTRPPPDPTLYYPSRTRNFSVTVTGEKEADSEVFLYEKNTNYLICDDNNVNSEWQCKILINSDGERCFYLFSVDRAGNRCGIKNFCITRDTTAPSFFSIENTSTSGNTTILSGEKDSNSYIFLNGELWNSTDFNSYNWSGEITPERGLNILNFSITDDLFNSTQRIYTFYHSLTPVLYNSYPMKGTEFSSPVTRIVLFFSFPVTLSSDCNENEILIRHNGTPYNLNTIKWAGREVILQPLQPIKGDLDGFFINSNCFVSFISNNPPWWREYPEKATTINGKKWFIPLKQVVDGYDSSLPSPLYTPVITSGTCNYYSCQITISPFYSNEGTGTEELLERIYISDYMELVTSSSLKNGAFTFNLDNFIPLTCPEINLKVSDNSGNSYSLSRIINPHINTEYVETVSNIRIWEYYAKIVTGDWNGDTIPDLAISLIKGPSDPDIYPFSEVEVYLFTLDPDGKWTGDYKKISIGTAGYGIAVSTSGGYEDTLLLLDPLTNQLGMFQWNMAATECVNRNEIVWVDLNSKLNLNGGIPFEITNISSLTGNNNNFALLIEKDDGDNFIVLDSSMKKIRSLYISGLFPKYPTVEKGNFASRGGNAESLCISNYTYNNGRGRVICYYGGGDFPQNYPYFSITDQEADLRNNFDFGYLISLVDLNGDNFQDLVAFEHGYQRRAFIYYGGDYPDTIPDLTFNYSAGNFSGKIQFKNREYLVGSNRSMGKLQIISVQNHRVHSYPVCVQGNELSIYDRIYQITKDSFILLKHDQNSNSVEIKFLYLQ